jgi:hypothetical protein
MLQTTGHGTDADPIPVRGAERLHPDDLRRLIREGHRCIQFEYCVSVVVATLRVRSATYLTDSWQERYLYGLSYSLIALAFGPWGVPWGPILTARAVWANLRGGVDMTAHTLTRLGGGESSRPPEPAGPVR